MIATRKLEKYIWSIALVKSHQNEVLVCAPGNCLLSDDGARGGFFFGQQAFLLYPNAEEPALHDQVKEFRGIEARVKHVDYFVRFILASRSKDDHYLVYSPKNLSHNHDLKTFFIVIIILVDENCINPDSSCFTLISEKM